MHQPSIIFMNRVYPPAHGATGRLLRDLARSFVREGWQVTIITTGAQSSSEQDGAIRVIRVKAAAKPRSIGAYLWTLFTMTMAALRRPKSDLIVTMTDPPLSAVAGHMIKTLKGSRHIHWAQDIYPDLLPVLGKAPSNRLMNAASAMARKALKACDKIIVIGRCMGKHLVKSGIDSSQITFIPNWPDLELVSPITAKGTPTITPEQSFFTPEETPRRFRVLYAGTLGLAHPVETILKAAEILQDTCPIVEFVFVGEGAGYDDLAAERSRRHLDNIRLLPYQPVGRLKDLMQSGDMHLVSMHKDAAGLLVPCKLYSALAAHRPCIFLGPAASEAAKTIRDYKAGTVMPQGRPQKLAEQIQTYVQDAQLWYAAHQGAIAASEIYTPKQSIRAWIKRAKSIVESDQN